MEEMEIKEELFNYICKQKKEDWGKVVEKHKDNPRAFETTIIGTGGDTALNLAITEEKQEVVEQLLGLLKDRESALKILRFKNEKKRTPLHAAAATGNEEICKLIANFDESLVLERDYTGETPLFRAVRYGRTEAFLYFHSLVFKEQPPAGRSYCWDDQDQTILHTAIARENFDLAFQIIHLYPELVNLVDKHGDTPLHSLARKPAAFESGSGLRGRNRIIYNCLSVKPLELKNPENSDSIKDKTNPKNPQENKSSSNVLDFINGLLSSRNAVQGHAKKEYADIDLESREGHIDQEGSHNAQKLTTRNYEQYSIMYFAKLVCSTVVPFVLGYGYMSVRKIQEQKQKHAWSAQVLETLLDNAAFFVGKKALRASDLQWKSGANTNDQKVKNDDSGERRHSDEKPGHDQDISEQGIGSAGVSETSKIKERSKEEDTKNETAILLAAKYGVVEIVERIIDKFPTAIYDKGEKNKNVVLVALKNRHLQMYKLFLSNYKRDHIVFQKMDDYGNTALHYAAMYDPKTVKPWPVPGAALQMQWEIKWLEYVENTMSPLLFSRTNKNGETPKELFSDNHKILVKEGGEWLMSTATSCSVVATLIATVAFASSTTAPGGTDKESGRPNLERNPTFELFAILSLVSLCFSVTSLLMFLAILTSRHQEKDFGKALPMKILLGLTSLFVAIASMLVTFCAGHFLVFEDKIRYAVLPVYAVTLLPLCFFAAAQFPLYFDLLLATFWSPF